MGRDISDHSESPVKGRGSPRRRSSPSRRSSPRREKSRSSYRDGSPAREKHSSHAKSPRHKRSTSPVSRSPSPRTKRLRRARAEREAEREHERNHSRANERSLQREGGSERETGIERKERRLGRDDSEGKPARSRYDHSTSPPDRHRRSKHRSHSPQPALETKVRVGEKVTDRDYEKNHVRGSDRSMQRERKDREMENERNERSGRDDTEHRSSRSRHGRSTSPSDRHHRNRHRSHSPQPPADLRAQDEVSTARGSEDRNDENDSMARMKATEQALDAKQKQQPSFELSGKLAAETNRVRGVTLLYDEPAEARKPVIRWRLYVFKAGEVLNEPLYIHRQSCYLFGRERRVADIPTDHPSCSKQHAVIQFRQVEIEKPDGSSSKQVRPYLMDLGSTNKTFINDTAIEPQRYYELKEKDTVKFGNSSREYVLLHENSSDAL